LYYHRICGQTTHKAPKKGMTDAIRHDVDAQGLHGSWCAFLAAFIALAVAPMVATADQSRLPTIGEVWLSEPVVAIPYMQAFRGGLRDLGYVEGRDAKAFRSLDARRSAADTCEHPEGWSC
jgi:hypothetical protein